MRNLRGRLERLEADRRAPAAGIDWDAVGSGDLRSVPLPATESDPVRMLRAECARVGVPFDAARFTSPPAGPRRIGDDPGADCDVIEQIIKLAALPDAASELRCNP